MIKLTLFLTRRADLTRQQFSDYWMNVHWPTVQSVPEVKKYTRRYVQQHNIGGTPNVITAAPYDGITEAWFDKIEDVGAVFGSPNWAKIVVPDEKKFLDRSKTLIMFSIEKVDYEPARGTRSGIWQCVSGLGALAAFGLARVVLRQAGDDQASGRCVAPPPQQHR
jgi:uncharacterized protein (TIGR02118 family)